MSNFLAVATATITLRELIAGPAGADVAGSHITTGRPDPLTGPDAKKPRVNVFLYQLSPNGAWRNSDLPTRDANGHVQRRPRAAIDLHFLLSCYGDAYTLEAERLLGSVVRTLHAEPVLSRDRIRSVVTATGGTTGFDWLKESDLAEDVELVKFTPQAVSLDDLSKLWSALRLEYAPSIAYLATVVLIEAERTAEAITPVLERLVYVVPFQQPRIESITAKSGGAITDGSVLVITGRDLRGDITTVRIAGQRIRPTLVSPTRLELPLSLITGGALRAGVQGAQVVYEQLMGDPVKAHAGDESEAHPFVLVPKISTIHRVGPAGPGKPQHVALDVVPPIAPHQRYALLLNELGAPANRDPGTFRFDAVAGKTAVGSPSIPIPGVPAATYVVRLSVDGAESALVQETDANKPTYGEFIGPTVVVQ